ncbi:MAG: Na+/H+ antiporter NhaC family protein [Planctomycetaceae bacterium]
MPVCSGLLDDVHRVLALVPMIARCFILVGMIGLTCPVSAHAAGPESAATVRLDVPQVVLNGVSVRAVRVTALLPNGSVDRAYNGPVRLDGVRLTGATASWSVMQDGVLLLESNLAERRRVLIESSHVVARLADGRETQANVTRIPGWLSLAPPVLAVVLAIAFRNVFLALAVATYGGALVIAQWNPVVAAIRTVDTYLLAELIQPQQLLDTGIPGDHLQVILFTMFLGAMIGVMGRSGGTRAMVTRLSRDSSSRQHGQLLTWCMGMLVFFDDYANTLLVGSTMRSVTDRLRISREKLAFLVDSTAAPVAGLVVVSTWVGFEVSQIQTAFNDLGLAPDLAFSTLIATIPYRFYSVFLLCFVGLLAYTGRDFGPMLQVERACVAAGGPQPDSSGAPDARLETETTEATQTGLVRNAIIPIGILVTLVVGGMVLDSERAISVLLLSSLAASLVAMVCAVGTQALSVKSAVVSWGHGARCMFQGLAVLAFAWAISSLCDDKHLNTATYIVELVGHRIAPRWLPALAFLISAVVAFSTGSSFATMGLLIPLFVSVAYLLLAELVSPTAVISHQILLGTLGAVLAGAIFGDHCSPISDTTVLSSAAAGVDHLAHVGTQLPYAVSVAMVSVVCGYIPCGFGVPVSVSLISGLVLLICIVRYVGRSVETVEPSVERRRA